MITPYLLLVIALLGNILSFSTKPIAKWAIVGAYLLCIGLLFWHYGPVNDKEALKYVGAAQDVIQRDTQDLFGNYLKYAAYILFLIPFVWVGSPAAAVAFQVVLAIMAAFALGRLAERLSGSRVTGVLATVAMLFCFPLQYWTLALYTESFFTSLSILFIERSMRTGYIDPKSIALGGLVVFARPMGFLFVGLVLLWQWTRSLKVERASLVLAGGAAILLLLAILIPGIERAQLEPIVDAHVIAGVPEDPGAMSLFEGSSILDAQYFLFRRHGAISAMSLAFRRVRSLFTLHRPWYSDLHNVFLGAHYLFYPLAILGSWRYCARREVGLLLAILASYTMLIGLTHDEWSGRFLVPVLPFILLFALLGAYQVSTGSLRTGNS